MPETSVPPDVYNFLLAHIDSIGAIEALILLRRNPEKSWAPDEVGTWLYISEVEAREILVQLAKDELLQSDGRVFAYRQLDEVREQLVQRVAETYQTQLVTVTKIIHAKPRRIREFANAFRLRKDRG